MHFVFSALKKFRYEKLVLGGTTRQLRRYIHSRIVSKNHHSRLGSARFLDILDERVVDWDIITVLALAVVCSDRCSFIYGIRGNIL